MHVCFPSSFLGAGIIMNFGPVAARIMNVPGVVVKCAYSILLQLEFHR